MPQPFCLWSRSTPLRFFFSHSVVTRPGCRSSSSREAAVPHDHLLDRAGLLDNARTASWIASRAQAEQDAILARLDQVLTDGPFAIPNSANIMWAVRS